MNVIRTQIYPSPLGDLLLGDWRGALVFCDWLLTRNGYASDSRVPHHLRAVMQEAVTDLLREAAAQLNAYFVGRLRTFDLPLHGAGTPFQQRVWLALREIPYGATCSYQDIAHGRSRALSVTIRCPSSSPATASSARTASSLATMAAPTRSISRNGCWRWNNVSPQARHQKTDKTVIIAAILLTT